MSISQLAGVTSIQQLDLKHFQPANILGTDPIELANIGMSFINCYRVVVQFEKGVSVNDWQSEAILNN